MVNLLGAACITAVINACKGENIPFVFGGDGATILIPPHLKPTCEKALRATAAMAASRFNMELRIGFVSVNELNENGYSLQVAKLEIAKDNYLAMMRGPALQEAERIVKSADDAPVLFSEDSADLEGLSCRWAAIANQKGLMLTLIVMANTDPSKVNEVYKKIIDEIEIEIGGSDSARPIGIGSIKPGSIFASAWTEGKLDGRSKGLARLTGFIKRVLISSFVVFLFRTGIRLKNVDIKAYLQEIPDNSDYRKFDGLLRMILDCSIEDAHKIEAVLQRWHRSGKIYYGTHRSATALMTCFVKEIRANNHLHFIDGAGGGYAMAAKKMKEQIAADLVATNEKLVSRPTQ